MEESFIKYAPNINLEYMKNIQLMELNKKKQVFEYNTLEPYKATVDSVMDIYDYLISDINNYVEKKAPFNIAISAAMGTLKTTVMKNVFKYLIDNNMGIPVYMSPFNFLTSQQILNNKIMRDEEVIAEFLTQKYYIGECKDDVNFEEITGEVLYSNLNHFRRLVRLMKKNKKPFVIFLDECHTVVTDFLYRNSSKISDFEKKQIMSEFELLLNECIDFSSDYGCLGVIMLSATMEPFANSKDILFTKFYDLDVHEEKRVQISLMEPLIVEKMNMENVFNIIVRTLEKTGKNSIQIFSWNTSLKKIKKLKAKLQNYQKKTGKFQDIDFEKSFEILHSDNVEDNETYNSIKNNLKIPDHVRILVGTSMMSTGINIIENNRDVDMTIFCEEETFSLTSEIQTMGRVRTGIRMLQMVTTYSSRKNIMHYETFIKQEKEEFIREIEAAISFLNQIRNLDTEKKKINQLMTYVNSRNLKNHYNYITVKDNSFVISKFALMAYMFLTYNRKHVLTSIKGLCSSIYYHKALKVHFIREPQTLDFKDNKQIYEDISKMKEPVTSEVDSDRNLKNQDVNEVKNIKVNANSELIKLLVGELEIDEVSEENRCNYNILKDKDYKFEVISRANLENDKKLSMKIVKAYLKDSHSKAKLEKMIKEYKITLNLENVQKAENKEMQELQLKTLSVCDKDNYTVFKVKEVLGKVYGSDKEWRNTSVKNKDRAYIYNFLLECNALGTYEFEDLEKTKKKQFSKSKSQEDELKRCLNLYLKLKKRKGELTFDVSSIRKI